MCSAPRSPSELRSVFGDNLRILAEPFPSISELARRLGINRTQFNRYLSGDSFPRPDVLARICAFFDRDARILLVPLADLDQSDDPMTGPVLGQFLGKGAVNVPERVFPSGFYRFSRPSFVDPSSCVIGLVWVFRDARNTYIKGFEAKQAMRAQGLSTDGQNRMFKGLVIQQDEGVSAIMSRLGNRTFSFNYLHPASSFENNFWVGYIGRTMRETPGVERVTRMVYEHLGTNVSTAIAAARQCGLHPKEALQPLHRRYLQLSKDFA